MYCCKSTKQQWLTSSQVFQGGINGWQPHLDGLASILQSARWTADSLNSDMIDSPEMRINSTHKNVFSHQDWTDHAYNFLASVVVWFDILSCVSTGRKPRLDYKAWLQKQEIDLAQVIGCQNWAMDAIGDLASLNAWKVQNTTSKTLSVPQLVKRGEEIQGRLERGLMELETGMEEVITQILMIISELILYLGSPVNYACHNSRVCIISTRVSSDDHLGGSSRSRRNPCRGRDSDIRLLQNRKTRAFYSLSGMADLHSWKYGRTQTSAIFRTPGLSCPDPRRWAKIWQRRNNVTDLETMLARTS